MITSIEVNDCCYFKFDDPSTVHYDLLNLWLIFDLVTGHRNSISNYGAGIFSQYTTLLRLNYKAGEKTDLIVSNSGIELHLSLFNGIVIEQPTIDYIYVSLNMVSISHGILDFCVVDKNLPYTKYTLTKPGINFINSNIKSYESLSGISLISWNSAYLRTDDNKLYVLELKKLSSAANFLINFFKWCYHLYKYNSENKILIIDIPLEKYLSKNDISLTLEITNKLDIKIIYINLERC